MGERRPSLPKYWPLEASGPKRSRRGATVPAAGGSAPTSAGALPMASPTANTRRSVSIIPGVHAFTKHPAGRPAEPAFATERAARTRRQNGHVQMRNDTIADNLPSTYLFRRALGETVRTPRVVRVREIPQSSPLSHWYKLDTRAQRLRRLPRSNRDE